MKFFKYCGLLVLILIFWVNRLNLPEVSLSYFHFNLAPKFQFQQESDDSQRTPSRLQNHVEDRYVYFKGDPRDPQVRKYPKYWNPKNTGALYVGPFGREIVKSLGFFKPPKLSSMLKPHTEKSLAKVYASEIVSAPTKCSIDFVKFYADVVRGVLVSMTKTNHRLYNRVKQKHGYEIRMGFQHGTIFEKEKIQMQFALAIYDSNDRVREYIHLDFLETNMDDYGKAFCDPEHPRHRSKKLLAKHVVDKIFESVPGYHRLPVDQWADIRAKLSEEAHKATR